MKLVDILAVNLKCWPDHMTHLWVSAGNTIYGKNGLFEFEMNGGWDKPEDHRTVSVSRAEWQAAVDALNAPKVVEWPDLGETVEVIKGPAEWSDEQIGMISRKGKVRSIFKNDCDQKIVAIELSSGECKCFIVECIKPVRTVDQEAAEEREAIREFLISEHQNGGLIGIAKALHESGYRKQVVK